MTSLPLLNFEQALRAVAACVRAKRTCALVGSPGGGKTSVWRMVAEHFQLLDAIVPAPAYEAVDIVGTPYVARGQFQRALDPRIASACTAPALLVFDDATLAPRAVEAALLRVVLEHGTGTFDLHEDTRVGLAFNFADQTPGGGVFSAAMIARVVQIRLAVSVEETQAFFAGEAVRMPTDVVLSAQAFAQQRIRERASFAQVLAKRPDLLQPDPPPGSLRDGAPFGSARAWEIGLDVLAAHGSAADLVGEALLAGAVGRDLAVAYLAARGQVAAYPSVAEIVHGPSAAPLVVGVHEIGVLPTIRAAAAQDVWAAWVYVGRLTAEVAAAAAQILIPIKGSAKSTHAAAGRAAAQRILRQVGQ